MGLWLPSTKVTKRNWVNIDGVDPYWVSRGLTAAYALTFDKWEIEQVTQRALGSSTAGLPTFPNGLLRTIGTDSNYVSLPHNIPLNVGGTISFVWGCKYISGSARDWTLRQSAAANNGWGFGGSATNDFIQSSAGTPDVELVFRSAGAGMGNYACVSEAANDFYGVSYVGSTLLKKVDTTNVQPTGVDRSYVALGATVQSTVLSVSIVEFTHFFIFNKAINQAEAMALVENPWQVFRQHRSPTYFFGIRRRRQQFCQE